MRRIGGSMFMAAAEQVSQRPRTQDVFAVLYVAGGANLQAAINALSFTPDLVIAKATNNTGPWIIRDTARGMGLSFAFAGADEAAFSGYPADPVGSTVNWVAWCFKRGFGFFDVRTRASAASGRAPHGLGEGPGLILPKKRVGGAGGVGNWPVYCNRFGAPLDQFMYINGSFPVAVAAGAWGTALPTASDFGYGAYNDVGSSGANYVDYVFGDSLDPKGLIRTFAVTADAAGAASINTGWSEGAQAFLIKRYDSGGPSIGPDTEWQMFDSQRAPSILSSTPPAFNQSYLALNLPDPETGAPRISQTAGVVSFKMANAFASYIVVAIRAPVAWS